MATIDQKLVAFRRDIMSRVVGSLMDLEGESRYLCDGLSLFSEALNFMTFRFIEKSVFSKKIEKSVYKSAS